MPACSRPAGQSAATGPSAIDAISLDGDEIRLERAAVRELAGELAGRLYLPADEGYDSARIIWNGMFADKRPAMIAQCTTVDDVRNAVTFAAERGLLVAVKGGGHSLPGKSTCDGGMMIDLSQMHATEVDPANRTIRVQGGALISVIAPHKDRPF